MPDPTRCPSNPMSSDVMILRLHADLDLVRACLRGDRRSLAEFDRLLHQVIAPVCVRLEVHRSDRADLHQRLLLRLLLDVPGRPAQLRSYRGQGSLVAWLRICATREILGVSLLGVGRAMDQPSFIRPGIALTVAGIPLAAAGIVMTILGRTRFEMVDRNAVAHGPARRRVAARLRAAAVGRI